MAPVCHDCIHGKSDLKSGSENNSDSDSESHGSSASGSRSNSVNTVRNGINYSSPESNRSGSRSPSLPNSPESVSSPGSQRSRRDSASSCPASASPGAASASPGSASASPGPASPGPASPGLASTGLASTGPLLGSGRSSPALSVSRSASRSSEQKSSSGSAGHSEVVANITPPDEVSNASEKSRTPTPEVNGIGTSASLSTGSNASRQSAGDSYNISDSEPFQFNERSGSSAEKDEFENKDHESSATPENRASSKSDSESEDESKNNSSKVKSDSLSPKKSPNEKDGNLSPQNASRSRSASLDSDSGSDEGPNNIIRKRKREVLSDDSGSDAEKKKIDTGEDKDDGDESEKDLVIDAEALFGDASDISSDEEGKKKKENKKAEEVEKDQEEKEQSEAESEKPKSGEEDNEIGAEDKDEEEKENIPEEPPPETRIDVQIPKITTDLGKDIHFVKLPNFLSVETRPFDPSTYEDEIDEEETLDEEGRARLKLKVENTIRWREVTKQNGEFEKQSNARFVKWSDGSMSLHLGSEIFDVYKQPLQGDHNHLFIRQGTGLQGQAVFRTKLTFRPHSTESFTHRKMTMSLADRSQKTAGIKILSLVGKDPEAHRGELIKKEEERLRASVRRESRQKRIREKGANRGLSAGYLEPDRYGEADSDDEGISISAIKKQHKNKMTNPRDDRSHIYSSDEDGSDIETRRARRLDKAKALKDSDSEGSGGGDGGGASKSGDRSSSEED